MAAKPRTLRTLTQVDLSNEVIHFTYRLGLVNNDVDPAIRNADAATRLTRILSEHALRAHQVFYNTQGDPVVCFTEATRAGLTQLVGEGRYLPWGLGFSKDFVFANDGGPAFYVRGDQWSSFQGDVTSPRLRAFATRYWPGTDDADAEGALKTVSEYAHEREWRVPRPDADPLLRFQYADVRLVLIPSVAALDIVRAAVPVGALDHVEVLMLKGLHI